VCSGRGQAFTAVDSASTVGPVEASGAVRAGDRVLAVGGASVAGRGADEVAAMVGAAARPLTVVFQPATFSM
jgi:C-terminal processing protease CtpA/Prc